jgi:hypothetical protein
VGGGGTPAPPVRITIDPVNPGGAESPVADCPETCVERDCELPDVPAPMEEGDRVGSVWEEPCCAPAFAAT